MKFRTFFYFCGSFLPSWIRIRIHWRDWIRILSGSETLEETKLENIVEAMSCIRLPHVSCSGGWPGHGHARLPWPEGARVSQWRHFRSDMWRPASACRHLHSISFQLDRWRHFRFDMWRPASASRHLHSISFQPDRWRKKQDFAYWSQQPFLVA